MPIIGVLFIAIVDEFKVKRHTNSAVVRYIIVDVQINGGQIWYLYYLFTENGTIAYMKQHFLNYTGGYQIILLSLVLNHKECLSNFD